MKILVTGANGILGNRLVVKLLEKGHDVIGVGMGPSRVKEAVGPGYLYKSLDITEGEEVNKFLTHSRPHSIVHAAAMTQVDQCEMNKVDCWNTNVTATRFIVDAAKEIAARMILLSTDFVFDGLKGPYKEEDQPNPVNYYGSSKLAAEKAVSDSKLSWAIVRTVLVLAKTNLGQRDNILTRTKQLLENGESIRMVDDQVRTPTFVDDLANGILLMLEKESEGIFHIAGKDTLTPYSIAIKIAEHLGLDKSLVKKVESGILTQAAIRPAITGFVIEKAKRELGYNPRSFEEILAEVFQK